MATAHQFFLVFLLSTLASSTCSKYLRLPLFHSHALTNRLTNSALSPKAKLLQAAFRTISRAIFLSQTLTKHADSSDFTYPLVEGMGGGDYIMMLKLGTPQQNFPCIMDTGSSLVWVQCKPCMHCAYSHGPQLNPLKSSSFKAVPCDNKFCEDVRSLSSTHNGHSSLQKCSNSTCIYRYAYGSGLSIGMLSTESITLDELNKIANFTFGCAHKTVGDFNSAGLVGLGPAPYSFVSQLGEIFGRKFAYCFTSQLLNPNSDVKEEAGYVRFGDSAEEFKQEKLYFTPILANYHIAEAQYYYVGLQGISIGGKRLSLSASIFQIDEQGFSGTIIDSGTTLSVLPSPAMRAVREAISSKVPYREINHEPAGGEGINLMCYDVQEDEYSLFPSFIFHFGGTDVELPLENTYAPFEESLYCLTMVECSSCTISIIGNVQQQSFTVLYDLEKHQIGFAKNAGCHHEV